jgi:hypothetical protein
MTIHQVRRLIRLHEKATRHSNEYKKLSGDMSAQSKALRHLDKADRLYFQVRTLIRDCASVATIPERNLPDAGFSARQY